MFTVDFASQKCHSASAVLFLFSRKNLNYLMIYAMPAGMKKKDQKMPQIRRMLPVNAQRRFVVEKI
jgi:hypothetical protein